MKTLLLNGECVAKLRKLPKNSVHACVTDPPYGLSANIDAAEILRQWLENGVYEPKAKGGFMGKAWDATVPPPRLWREVLRVLKPGAYCLAFFGARTYDLGVMSMRLAGFEPRDCCVWHHAQGFPKSVNIGKGIDKKLGAEREVVGKREHPTLKDKSKIDRQGKQQFHGTNSIRDEWDVTEPATEEARRWEGWGSALKPSSEYIVVAQKRGTGTIVENVLAHGCGALNIDGCRIAFQENDDSRIGKGYTHKAMAGITPGLGKKYNEDGTATALYKENGRYPSNVVLTHAEECGETCVLGCPVRTMNEQYGGDAARFYFCAKAGRSERNGGLEGRNHHPTVKPVELMRYLVRLVTPAKGIVLDPFMGSGSTGVACMQERLRFIGIERETDYFQVAEKRIEHAKAAALNLLGL